MKPGAACFLLVTVDKNFLLAVAAVSSNDVWAGGYAENTARAPYDVPLIEHYDGQSWTIVPSVYPAPSQYNQLYGIAVLAPNDIWAVGYANKKQQIVIGNAIAFLNSFATSNDC
jgi:hypothetical protein